MPADRAKPFSNEAEQAVLGCMLLSETAVASACSALKPEDFYSPANREIFETAQKLFSETKVVDLVTMTNALKEYRY